jgi:hypothetical protein
MLHPACGICTGTIKSSTKQLTQVWFGKTFSKPASLERASLVALPLAISQKVSLETKTLRFFNPDEKKQKINLNPVPKMGPPGGPIFGTACAAYKKKQKKIIFTVLFLGPCGGTKNDAAKSQNPRNRQKITSAFI